MGSSPLSSLLAASFVALLASVAPTAASSRSITTPPRIFPAPQDALTPDGRPTSEAMEILRARTRGRPVRLDFGGSLYDVREVRLDSEGVTCSAERGAKHGPPGPQPIRWQDVHGIETRRSYLVPGMAVGALALAITAGVLIHGESDPGPGMAVLLAFPPAGALAGGLIGAFVPRWNHEWPPAKPRSRVLH